MIPLHSHSIIADVMSHRSTAPVPFERPELLHHCYPDMYAKEMRIPTGYLIGKHLHTFDHFSILAQGSVEISRDGVKEILHAPQLVHIAAGVTHVIHALTDAVWFCIHAVEDSTPETVDNVLITKGG